MSVITITTPFNIDLEFRIAPFLKRLIAWVLDIILIYLYVYVMYSWAVEPLQGSRDLMTTASILIIAIPAYSYHLVAEYFFGGQSVGKKLMGIKVIDISGTEASGSQYLLRWLFRLVDMTITMGAGAVMSAALSRYNQRLGDMVAGTVVIDTRHETDLGDTIYLELEEEDYQPVFPEVMRLSDRDINGIRNLLHTKGSNRDTVLYMEQVAERIRQVLQLRTDLEPRSMLEQLLKDYNRLTRN